MRVLSIVLVSTMLLVGSAWSQPRQRNPNPPRTTDPAAMSFEQLTDYCRRKVFKRLGTHYYPGWIAVEEDALERNVDGCIRNKGKF